MKLVFFIITSCFDKDDNSISNMKRETVGLNSENTKPTQKPNMVTSQYWGTHYTSDTRNWDEMIFFLYPQNQTYIDLEKYPPTSNYLKIFQICLSFLIYVW